MRTCSNSAYFLQSTTKYVIFSTYYNVVNAEDSCKQRKRFIGILVKEGVQEQVELFTKYLGLGLLGEEEEFS